MMVMTVKGGKLVVLDAKVHYIGQGFVEGMPFRASMENLPIMLFNYARHTMLSRIMMLLP
jgi:hypothetical protein